MPVLAPVGNALTDLGYGRSLMKDLVLVGGGHAHVQVLKRWAMEPMRDVRLTVIVDRPTAVYSGMVPGYVAGQYQAHELEIDVRPLALRAGARMIHAPATGLDVEAKHIEVAGRPPVRYDVAAFDIGSTVVGLDLPGVREHAVATRPIGDFVVYMKKVLGGPSAARRIVVVGGGAAGVELAFSVRARLGRDAQVTLLEGGDRVLSDMPAGLRRRALTHAAAMDIEVRTNTRVRAIREGVLELAQTDAPDLEFDVVFWVAGAAAHDVFASSDVATHDGFACVRDTLQLLDTDDVFAVGDCAHFVSRPLPKAGVYAVRQGPVLEENLRAQILGRSLQRYRPQRDFLALLNLGDGRAIGSKWNVAFEGRWVFRLKDVIDRRFMEKFQVLHDGELTAAFEPMSAMDDMVCGGCAAKLGESQLDAALGRLPATTDDRVVLGVAERDDVAAVRAGDGLLVSNTDALKAFTDDPFLVGEVAAVNAASDLWAKGVPPRFAQALVVVPEGEDAGEVLYLALAGARRAFDASGVTLLGGHTLTGDALYVGFTMWGETETDAPLLTLKGLRTGDELVLTKALGTGVVFYADMRGQAAGEWVDAAFASMRAANDIASRVAVEVGASACTDVTGFGLAGHLGEMCRASGVTATVDVEALPLLPGVERLLELGSRSTFHAENAKAARAMKIGEKWATRARTQVLFDPQTSGGLLLGSRSGAAVVEKLEAAGARGWVIGRVVERDPDGAVLRID